MGKKSKKVIIPIILIGLIFLAIFFSLNEKKKITDDIVILYTNDVHCGIDEYIGYAGLIEYKEDIEEQTPYVTLVDCGDAIQGEYIGLVSEGEYIVDIMNRVGYDFAILGNHEFDYGMESLSELIEKADAQYLACNITYTGNSENALFGVKPYEIVEFGDTSVAFIGVSTPWSITASSPTSFMEDGRFVFDFASGEDGKELYDCVQRYVDECEDAGADYVIALTHLGDGAEYAPFSSVDLARATEGIDVILDGHAHSTIPCLTEKNKAGEDVLISSTGSKLANIGKLVIGAEGNISTELISDYIEKDEKMVVFLDEMQAAFEAELSEEVAVSDVELKVATADGIRMVRNRETNMGDFCADAYRMVAGADIGFVNGGGIRSGLPEGEITYADLFEVHPFGNSLCTVEATGQEILDCLEMSCRKMLFETSKDGSAVGENGGFLQVSGMKFTVDTSVESSVIIDENEMFVSVGGERRVKDVFVMCKDGTYGPIEANKVYVVAANDYLLKEGGDGYSMFMDNEFLISEGMQDYQVLATYMMEILDGRIGMSYVEEEKRIVVE